MSTRPTPTIGEASKFYGYIIGIGIIESPGEEIGRRLYASFEYNGITTVFLVPDADLFQILSNHLVKMAWSRTNTDDYGYEKLWIEKKNGKWVVDLP